MTGPPIAVEDLHLSYGRSRVLRGIGLQVAAGESLGLIGPNGAGKTSLVSCLLGLVRPQRGSVRIAGRGPEAVEVRSRLGYVPERCSVDRSSTARGSLHLHHELCGLPAEDRAAEVAELLARTGLGELADRPARLFSKGQLQRLAFATALVGRPSWLVLDEPFSGVDPAGVRSLRALISELRDQGATLVINSHRLDQVARLCDRVALLSRGRLVGLHDVDEDSESLEGLVVGVSGDAP